MASKEGKVAAVVRGMGPERTAKFVAEVCGDDMHAARVASLANAVTGALVAAALGVSAIGAGLAQARGTTTKHSVKQVDRLLSNAKLDPWGFFGRWVPHVLGARKAVVVSVDWTSFAADGHEVLALSMATRHGRSTPLLWRTVEASDLKGKRNDHEDALLKRLREVVPEDVKVTVLADRGFADCELFDFLEALGFEYVIRLRGNFLVTSADGEKRKASDWVGAGGRARTLRGATVTDAQQWKAATVACLQDRGMKEPWCLVASERRSARSMAALYGRRWGIETSFRDVKNPRFGMGLKETRVGRTDRRDRMLLVGAMAVALLTLLGAAGEKLGYDRWLKTNTSRQRQHSLFRQGLMLHGHLANWPDDKVRPLLEAFEEMILEQRIFRDVFGVI